jgi:IPT/TIG domain
LSLKQEGRADDALGVTHFSSPRLLRAFTVVFGVVALSVPIGAATAAAPVAAAVPTQAPWISRTAPTIGTSHGGDVVTITGQHFAGITSVKLGGVPATDVVVASDTKITVTTPAHSVGNARVRVSGPGRSSVPGVTYEFIDPPTVTGMSSPTGSTAGGTSVTVTGTNLSDPSNVRFDGIPAPSIAVVNATTLTVTTPAHVAGVVRVRVVSPHTSSARASAARFTYGAPPAITSKSPPNGPTTGGTSVHINGSGFTGTTSVQFFDTEVSFVVNSDTQITAISPPHAAGFVGVRVTTPFGTHLDPSYAYPFIYDP